MSGYRIEPLSGGHDRTSFVSGSVELDRYFREQAGQDIRRRLSHCFVAIDEQGAVAGFYTLAASSLAVDQLPPERTRKLPRYPVVPAVLLGRLAVSTACQKQGLGAALLADAVLRATRNEAMAHLLIVDAKDEAAAAFYRGHGFLPFPDSPLRLGRLL